MGGTGGLPEWMQEGARRESTQGVLGEGDGRVLRRGVGRGWWCCGGVLEPGTPRESALLRSSPGSQSPAQGVQSEAGAAGRMSGSGK